MVVAGDKDDKGEEKTETVELWLRDTVDVIKDLFDNPAFKDVFALEPELHFADEELKQRIVDEAWTAEWWHRLQVRVLTRSSCDF
jgi:hypothetical protein